MYPYHCTPFINTQYSVDVIARYNPNPYTNTHRWSHNFSVPHDGAYQIHTAPGAQFVIVPQNHPVDHSKLRPVSNGSVVHFTPGVSYAIFDVVGVDREVKAGFKGLPIKFVFVGK